MADTVLGVAGEGRTKATAERDRARGQETTARTDLDAARIALETATASLTDLQDEAAGLRRDIAQAPSAAQGEALFKLLNDNTIAVRARQAELADAAERVADGRTRVATAQDELEVAGAAVRAAEAAAVAAEAVDDAHSAWATAATNAPLKDLPKKADVTKAGDAKTALTAATARLNGDKGGDIPKALFERAHDRRAKRNARLTAMAGAAGAADAKLADEAAKVSLAGKRAKAQVAYDRDSAALRDFALTAQERYDHALSLLLTVGAAPALAATDAARVAALATEAATANVYALELARDVAREALLAGRRAVDAARLAALATDPSVDPDTVAAVQTALALVTAPAGTLVTALATAQTAFAAQAAKLDALEAAIPEPTWALYQDYEEAVELLDALAATVPATVADLAASEDAYAKALRAEREAAAIVLAVGELVRVIDGRADVAAQTRPARLLEALRGDA